MTVLEATVEIVKAALSAPTNTAIVPIAHITDDAHRQKFLKGITELYKTIEGLKGGSL